MSTITGPLKGGTAQHFTWGKREMKIKFSNFLYVKFIARVYVILIYDVYTVLIDVMKR